jgi:hypothetical protein
MNEHPTPVKIEPCPCGSDEGHPDLVHYSIRLVTAPIDDPLRPDGYMHAQVDINLQ